MDSGADPEDDDSKNDAALLLSVPEIIDFRQSFESLFFISSFLCRQSDKTTNKGTDEVTLSFCFLI
jgi:hypothetical protein